MSDEQELEAGKRAQIAANKMNYALQYTSLTVEVGGKNITTLRSPVDAMEARQASAETFLLRSLHSPMSIAPNAVPNGSIALRFACNWMSWPWAF